MDQDIRPEFSAVLNEVVRKRIKIINDQQQQLSHPLGSLEREGEDIHPQKNHSKAVVGSGIPMLGSSAPLHSTLAYSAHL